MHVCPKCKKIFSYIRDFNRHMKRKYPCTGSKHECHKCGKQYATSSGLSKHKKKCKGYQKNKYLEIQPVDNQNTTNGQPIFDNKIQNISLNESMPPKKKRPPNRQKLKEKIICQFCEKEFSYRQTYNRHIRHRCKVLKHKQNQEEVFPDSTDLPYIYKNKNNGIRYPDIQNHTYQKTNNYGEENLEWLKENFFDVLQRTESIHNLSDFVKFGFQQIHCNPNQIENHNVNISSKKDYFTKGIMSVYRNDVWELEENKNVILQSIRRFANIMEEQLDERMTQYTQIIPDPPKLHQSVDKIMTFIQSFDDSDTLNRSGDLIDDVKGGVFVMMDNFKHKCPLLEKKEPDISHLNRIIIDPSIIHIDDEPRVSIEEIDTGNISIGNIEDIGKFIDAD